jgi:hypothetical protein
MEGIWGVADVDADEEEDADEGADEDEDMSSSSQSSHASKFGVERGVPRIIRVSGAGDNISNGTYLDTSQNCRCRLGWCTSATRGRSIAEAAAIA